MKVIKKFIAVLCSATLVLAAPLTAFATEPDPVAPTTGTAGAGNVLSYNFDTVVVPTTIKITFNPQGLKIAKRAGETAVTDQIVSLNYGIASKASMDKKVIVKFAANKTLSGESSDIEFVDSADKATAKSDSNEDGAVNGDHKIFLQVAPASDTPTIYSASEAAGEAFAVTPVAATESDPGANTDNVSAANLSDVVMTKATAGVQTFATATSGAKNDAYAVMGYKLTKATYEAMTDLTFDTTAEQVADKMEITALGQITGFTFSGTMNTNTDWTKANLSTIAITPIYELQDAGGEEAIANTQGGITLTEDEDLAEPDKPLSADAVAAAAFKTTHATILAKTTENVTADDLTAINTALTAYEALSDEVKALLTTEKALLDDLKSAAEAATAKAGTLEAQKIGSSWYIVIKGENGAEFEDNKLTSFKINTKDVTSMALFYQGMYGVSTTNLTSVDVSTATGAELTAEFTVDGVDYTASYTVP